MADSDRIVLPDEIEDVKANATGGAGAGETIADDNRMVFPDEVKDVAATAGSAGAGEIVPDFDYDRIVFPDEVEKVKAAATAGECNSVDAPQIDVRFHDPNNIL